MSINTLLDPVTNFGKVTVSTVYTSTDLIVGLNTNEGLKLPDTSAGKQFNLVWYNSTDYPDPSDDPNVEIVRCTTRTVDTLTITRAQEGTTASNKNIVNKIYKMVLSPTKKTIDDIGTEHVKKTGDTMTGVLTQNGTNLAGTAYRSQSFQNLLKNGDFERWDAGTSTSPTGWLLGGGGALGIAREATEVKTGTYSAKLTFGTNDYYFYQYLQNPTTFIGKTITFNAWIKTSTASHARLRISTNIASALGNYHTGSGTWELMSIQYTVPSGTTSIWAAIDLVTSGIAYADGAILVEGSVCPAFTPHPFDLMLAEPRFKTVYYTRDMTTASGNVSYTGAGFRPSSIEIVAMHSNGKDWSNATINPDGSFASIIAYNGGTVGSGGSVGAIIVYLQTAGSVVQQASLASMDADGMTLSWSKTGSTAGTGHMKVTYYR